MESHLKKDINLDPFIIPYTKINSKWITDLNIKANTVKLPEENIEEHFCDLELSKNFLDLTQKYKS